MTVWSSIELFGSDGQMLIIQLPDLKIWGMVNVVDCSSAVCDNELILSGAKNGRLVGILAKAKEQAERSRRPRVFRSRIFGGR